MSDGLAGSETAPPFLETTAPPWAAQGFASLLLVLFTSAAVAVVVVRVPETVTAPFVLAPLRGSDPVRAFRSGIVSEVRVAEAQGVSAGEAMFTIASSSVGDRAAEWKSLESQILGAQEFLGSRRQRDVSQRRADEEEMLRLEARASSLARTIELRKQQLAMARERVARQDEVFKLGLVSWMEMSRLKSEADSLSLELERADVEHVETRKSLGRLRHETEARLAESKEIEGSLLEEQDRARIRKTALDQDWVHQGDQLVAKAPCAGTVLKVAIRSPGAVVQEGELLAEVHCGGDRLQAELTLPQEVTALVRPGQSVKLLYDAYPYQRYGVKIATLRWISPSGESTGVRAFAELESDTVMVGGQPRGLVAGLAGRARVVVGQRTLVSYAFEPIRQLRENMRAQ